MMTGEGDASSKAFWCVAYAFGIIGFLVIYGLQQEKIMTDKYDGDKFGVSAFLVLCNRIATIIFSTVLMFYRGEGFRPQAPIWKYALVSVSNVVASECQYEALKHVSFPVQMLAKSFKMMPVMLWGMAIAGKRYGCTDWVIAFLVTGGVTEFLLTGPTSSDGGNSEWAGMLLLLVYLLADGFTSPFQQQLFEQHRTSKFNQMFYIGVCAAGLSTLQLFLFGDMISSLEFCNEHPALVVDVVVLSTTNVFSQFCIYSMIKEYGALVFAATMNVRQVVSIIISYITFHHFITVWQVLGLVMVFGALGYKSFLGLAAGSPADEEPLVKHPLRGEDDLKGTEKSV